MIIPEVLENRRYISFPLINFIYKWIITRYKILYDHTALPNIIHISYIFQRTRLIYAFFLILFLLFMHQILKDKFSSYSKFKKSYF